MSDFLRWLYAHYIRPQLDAAPPEEYEAHLSQLENGLPPYLREDYARVREFTQCGEQQYRRGDGEKAAPVGDLQIGQGSALHEIDVDQAAAHRGGRRPQKTHRPPPGDGALSQLHADAVVCDGVEPVPG